MKAQLKRISECADILAGYSLKARAEHEPEGSHQVMMVKHLSGSARYHYISAHELRMTPDRDVSKYLIQSGDVLFVSRGTQNTATYVESVPENTITSGSIYILRAKKGVNPRYLAWCINQDATRAAINQVRTGAGTPIVQRSTFGEINILLPSLEKQKKIAKLGDLMDKERQLYQQLVQQTENFHKLVGSKLLSQMHS